MELRRSRRRWPTPLGDLLLAAVALAFLAALGWRFDRVTGIFALACIFFCVADSHFLLGSANHTYHEGTLYDAGWAVGMVLWSVAVRQRNDYLASARRRERSVVPIIMQPLSFMVTVFAVLIVAETSHVSDHLLAVGIALVAVLLRTMIMVRNLTQDKVAMREASMDKLTELPNRQGLLQNLRVLLHGEVDDGCALVLIGLSNLREITNAFGHEVGDQTVLSVAQRLNNVRRARGYLARLREDEFAMLASLDGDLTGGLTLANRALAIFAEPILIGELAINARAKIGVAQYPEHASNELDLLRLANDAMLHAVTVDSAIELSDANRTDLGRNRIILTKELRKALVTDELTCYYQPQIEIASGHVVGVEALLRWEHPVRGLVQPYQFLDIARETGQLSAVSRRVLHVVAAQSRA